MRWFAPGVLLILLIFLLRGKFLSLLAFLLSPLIALLDRIPAGFFAVFFPGFLILALGAYYAWYMKRSRLRVYETLSPRMREEIDQERKASIQRRQKFLEAMSQAELQTGVPKREPSEP